ncbi:hypothetical protein TNCV_31521 [Trichonephila clavipes]|nr:hypothetical protein TNCV_31521 [Trichonephila clavipes]
MVDMTLGLYPSGYGFESRVSLKIHRKDSKAKLFDITLAMSMIVTGNSEILFKILVPLFDAHSKCPCTHLNHLDKKITPNSKAVLVEKQRKLSEHDTARNVLIRQTNKLDDEPLVNAFVRACSKKIVKMVENRFNQCNESRGF